MATGTGGLGAVRGTDLVTALPASGETGAGTTDPGETGALRAGAEATGADAGLTGAGGGDSLQSGARSPLRRPVVEHPANPKASRPDNILAGVDTLPLCETVCGTQGQNRTRPSSSWHAGFSNLHLERRQGRSKRQLRILVAITGASGALYAQRLLDNLPPTQHEVHVVLSSYAHVVINEELPGGLRLPAGATSHPLKSMNAPFASGSNAPDAMVIIPCSMGTLGRIAHGYSEDVLLRAADVVLKERKKLILVPRETPLNLVHIRNFELLLSAGATILPANPAFYTRPQTVEQVVDTVVARVLDHLGIAHQLVARWGEEGV